MSTLFLVNVPHNCSDTELVEWVESAGVAVQKLWVIRDVVAGVSPSFAYVDIGEKVPLADAIDRLNGQHIRERTILVSEARRRPAAA